MQEALLEAYENKEGELVLKYLCDGRSEEYRDYGDDKGKVKSFKPQN